MVDGQRDVAYADIDERLKRATEDGEQVTLDVEEPPVVAQPTGTPLPEPPVSPGRPPGKLYGKSLIDDLQARKAEMKAKQRYVSSIYRITGTSTLATGCSGVTTDPL